MSKRQRQDDSAEVPRKKVRKGFSVGPENLPDGTYKRKTQKIKNDLIQNAKVKKAYAKIKAQEQREENDSTRYDPYSSLQVGDYRDGVGQGTDDSVNDPSDIHPDRQAMLNEPEVQDKTESGNNYRPRFKSRRNQPHEPKHHRDSNTTGDNGEASLRRHPERYRKEYAQAEERKAALQAKQKRSEIREKDRRAMIKAKKPGKDGKQKLGRQGTLLLGRVKRMMGEGKI